MITSAIIKLRPLAACGLGEASLELQPCLNAAVFVFSLTGPVVDVKV